MGRIIRLMCFNVALHWMGLIAVCIVAAEVTLAVVESADAARTKAPGFEFFGGGSQAQPENGGGRQPAEKTPTELVAAPEAEIVSEAEAGQNGSAEDAGEYLVIREIRINGNTLLSSRDLLQNLPEVFNASDKPMVQAEPRDLYDFSILRDIIKEPGEPRQVSRRTMQGFTQYILAVYQDHGYAGIFVYIASRAVQDDKGPERGVLPVEVVEAKVSEIKVTSYDTKRQKTEKGILRPDLVRAWSPAKTGDPVKRKELDYFTKLLNLNPDRHVSAIISRGSEPNSLALGYELYEASPWHYYIQVDNSGTEERQWAPRLGLINTNLTGRDDRFSAIWQAPFEKGFEDNYLAFGSYELPVFSPRLRLGVFAGRSRFDTTPAGGPLNFVGDGSFYGGTLRYNVFWRQGWFFDITSSLSHENSKVTPSLFKMMASDVTMDLWAVGIDLHRSSDTSNTSISLNRIQSIGASSQADFTRARQGSEPHFDIYTTSTSFSKYTNANKLHRVTGALRWTIAGDRLPPSKMTTFGGMYSVRGYKEDEIVADGGLLASFQYEFDLLKYCRLEEDQGSNSNGDASGSNASLRKLAI